MSARRFTPGCARVAAAPRFVALLLAMLCMAGLARAHFPSSRQVAEALAERNRAGGRTRPLRLLVDLYLGDRVDVVASGTLESDPSGAARLELASERGIVERHLLLGGTVRASRDGRSISEPRPFLPPLSLLQAPTAAELLGRLSLLGARIGEISLGYAGDHDCYVLGGRDAASSFWVDLETLEPVRIERRDGVVFKMGPPRQFGEMILPEWIEAAGPGDFRSRLAIRDARPGTLALESFTPAWLFESAPPESAARLPAS